MYEQVIESKLGSTFVGSSTVSSSSDDAMGTKYSKDKEYLTKILLSLNVR